ncbi:MAG: hypothetical protein ACRDRH_00675 [Pseudonocardia sp.]
MNVAQGDARGRRAGIARMLALVFAAWSLGTAGWFAVDDPSVIRWVVAALLAGLGTASLVLAPLHDRPWVRTAVVAGHCVMIPLTFVLTIVAGSNLLYVGMALSTAILVTLRPRFRRMRPPARKVWLTLHVGFSVGWLGAALAMVVLSVVGATTSDLALRHYAYAFMHVFDLTIVIPLVLLSIITGLVVSLGTQWGLVKHWWVTIKFGISLGIVATAAVWENFLVRGLAEETAANPALDAAGRDWQLAACMIAFVIALWTATTLSVVKPGGRTRWGRRELAPRRREPVPAPSA